MNKTPTLRFKGFNNCWNLKKICELFDIITDFVAAGSFESLRNNVVYKQNPDFAQLVRTMDLKNRFTSKDFVFVDESAFKFLHRVNLNEQSIVLPNIGANIGEVYFINPSILPYKNNVLGPNAILLKSKSNNIAFLNYLLCCSNYRMQLKENVGASGQPKFNKTELKNFIFYTPSLEEQTKIATFLSAVDSKITSLERLVSHWQAYKKGIMQQIFTQQLRFKAPNGEDFPKWKERKLVDLAQIIGGGTPDSSNEIFWNGSINWFTPTEVGNSKYLSKSQRKITKEGLTNSSAKMLPVGSILLTTRATIGELGIILEESSTNQGFQSFIANNNTVNNFLYYLLATLKNTFLKKANGSTFLEISSTELKSIKVFVPSKDEQTKIATFLSSLDDKIAHLLQQLTSYRQFKKALLQQMFV